MQSKQIFTNVYGRFDEAAFGRVSHLQTPRTMALDVARSQTDPLRMSISGDLLWVTDDTTGSAHIRFNSIEAGRVPLLAGMIYSGAPFTEIWLDWDAQAGDVLALAHGTGLQIKPGNNISNISSILNPINTATGVLSSTQYHRASASSALHTIVTPAANVNGVRVDNFNLNTTVSGSVFLALMAKTSAPTSPTSDATAHTLAFVQTVGIGTANKLFLPFIVPAGFGLYEQCSNASSFSYVSVVYEVLP